MGEFGGQRDIGDAAVRGEEAGVGARASHRVVHGGHPVRHGQHTEAFRAGRLRAGEGGPGRRAPSSPDVIVCGRPQVFQVVLQLLAAETRRGHGQDGRPERGAPPPSVTRPLPVYDAVLPVSPLIRKRHLEGAGSGHPVTVPVHQPCRGSPGQPRGPRLHVGDLQRGPTVTGTGGILSVDIPEYPRHRKGRTTVSEELTAQIGPSAFLPVFIAIQPASEWMFMGTLSCGTWWVSRFPLI